MNQTYYLNRIFSELFDIEIRLMELENVQLDYKDAEDGQFVTKVMHLDMGRKTCWKKFRQSLNLILICLCTGF